MVRHPRRRTRVQQRLRTTVAACLLVFATAVAMAAWHPAIQLQHGTLAGHTEEAALNTWAVCLQEASHRSGVDPALFRAIVVVESGEHPFVFGWSDRQGVRRLYRAANYRQAVAQFNALEQQQIQFDVGLAQVNRRNLDTFERRLGIAPIQALDACTNVRLAGLVLGEQIRRHGHTWRAVAGYNGALAYAPRVHRVYCRELPEAASCRTPLPLAELLCEPIPVSQTERYYPVFRRLV